MKRFFALLSVAVLVAFATPAAADFNVSGTFLYEDLPIDINGFQSPHPNKPVRLVDVRVIDNSTQAVLATGATDLNGAFAFSVTDSQVRDIAILALTQSGMVSNLNHYVTQWSSTAVHAYQGTLVSGHDPNTDIGMGTVVMHYRAGAEPFNLYDAVLDASDFIASLQGGTRPTSCRVRFTLDTSNDVAYYSSSVVNIGGNFGYDDTICLHEFGHFTQDFYGDFSDNTGGTHYIGDSAQDARLSFGEGWPTYFESSAREWAGDTHPQVYLNSTGDSTTGVYSFSYDLETYSACSGASCEIAVSCVLWDINDGDATPDNTPGVDDEVGYQMNRAFSETWSFTRAYLSQPPFSGTLTYEDFHDLWLANIASPQQTELLAIERLNHGIEYSDDAYENDDSLAGAGTYHSFEDIGLGRKTHHSTWPQGDEDWILFEGLAGVAYRAETTIMRDGADTYLEFQDAGGAVLTSNDNVGTPVPGDYNTFELLRSQVNYTPATTQDLYVRVRRSPNSPYGVLSKYGNWELQIRTTSVPTTYPNLTTTPTSVYWITLDQNTQTTSNLVVGNTGTADTLDYVLVEATGDIPWVSEAPPTGAVPPGQTRTSVLTFDATGLAVGSYRDTLEVHCDDPNNPVRNLTLNLTVNPGQVGVEEVPAPLVARLDANSPNPFNPLTTIRFAVPTTGRVTLVIYDVQGREVRRLVDGVREAGEHAVIWNGRDGGEHAVPSGIYFYRLSAGSAAMSRKMVMAK